MEKIELLGSACFSHGPYTFYKAVRIGNGRILRLGSFFLTKLWSDADLVSIGELQLLWIDSRGPNTPLASLRLYFLPENTPDGRRDTHGEDEVLTISEKVVVRVHDLVTWLSPSLEWSWGREVNIPWTPSSSPESSPRRSEIAQPQVLTDPGIDFSDVEKQQKEYENNTNCVKKQDNQSRVVVLSYPRYCRYRALLRRLEGSEPSWLASSVAAALGGFTALPGTRVLFCRDTFDYPDLETHELLCNHLAPKLKGRPRRKRKKRSASPGESSNESEASVASTSKSIVTSLNHSVSIGRSANVRRSERKTTAEEKKFLMDVQNFMNSRGTPVGKTPLLGYRQIDLYLFYSKVQMLGGYESVSAGRLWKTIYDDIGGNTASTSAATITRRHYERLLLPYERYQRGEDAKLKPIQGRRSKTSSTSEDTMAESMTKQEPENNYPRESSPSIASEPMSNCNLNSSIHSNSHFTSITPPVQSILATTPFLPGDKPRSDPGKTSSLRSVRVKPDRLKSLNTIIAGSAAPSSQPPSPPPSSNTSTSTPSSTPSTTPTNGTSQTALERQLNASPLMSHQVAPSSSPSTPPTVVTLTPPPEKDMKDIKLDAKQTNLIAQGKENIPLYDEKPLYIEKVVAPRSPEVIDLESEEKLIIPSFKKRKLEILREGGLEVTAVELDSRPSVIQPHAAAPHPNAKVEEKVAPTTPAVSTPKLISVTVTPDIGHMLPSRANNNVAVSNSNVSNNSTATNSRVINVGNSGNALLQLYATAGVTRRFPASTPPVPMNDRQAPPRVTQGRSIFSHNEKTVYGNPKEILAVPNKYAGSGGGVNLVRNENPHHPGGVLDLTQKQTFSRPNLEIVRVPVLSRPSPLNLDTKSSQNSRDKSVAHYPPPPMEAPPRKNHYPVAATYTNVLDSRTMASNNLEITLVSPKKASPAPIRPNSVGSAGTMSPHRKTPQPLVNNKYPSGISRSEPVSPYTPRKSSHPVVIPNVPNLSQLNNVGAFGRNTASSMNLDKRKGESSRDHHRRTSEGEKQMTAHESLRRHSMPSAFVPPGVMANGPGAFLAPPPPGPQMPTNSPNKFLPIIDPMYYSAFYNGLLPSPMVAAAAAANPFLPPEFSAYYKELLAPSQSRLAIGQSPTVPTSK